METKERIQRFANQLLSDEKLAEDFGRDPAGVARDKVGPGNIPDTTIYRMVIAFLGVTLLVAAIAGIVSMFVGTGGAVPAALVALGSGALGALGGLLAPSPVSKGG